MTSAEWTISDPEFQADAVVPLNPVYPWGGHRGFAYDLVRWMRPARIVELGVHWGTSFFAFAQAIKDDKLPTELIGVDTFRGDEHAGFYGDEVLETVRRIIERYFQVQNVALRPMLFSEALGGVGDESVDLLHIDGLHTQEACRFDYTAWLPKLAPEGVVLFHDTAPSTGYGSAVFWKEVSASHPSFAFEHSWGLGVLFPRGDSRLRALRERRLDDLVGYYTHRAERRLAEARVRDLTRIADERHATIEAQAQLIQRRDEHIANLTRDLQAAHERRAELLERQRQLMSERDAWVSDLREGLGAARSLAAERDALTRRLESAEAMAVQRFERLQVLRRAFAELRRDRREDRCRVEALSAHLDRVNAALERRTAEAADLERRWKEQATMNQQLAARVDRLETDAELLAVRLEHVESLMETQRAQLGALMETRPGRQAAKRLAEAPAPPRVVVTVNGSPNGEPRG